MKKRKYFDWVKLFYLVERKTIIQIAVVILITSTPSHAQIKPDGTLGTENSLVTRNVTVKGSTADLIEGGAQKGSNLFHSFSDFNVNNRQRVYFDTPPGIKDIFTRVTGKSASNILGTLGVDGAANLYLLNPNGILFGPNAQLDIKGSFFATTANSFKFSDDSEFRATDPQAPPLLTMSVFKGVQYGSQPASITNQGNLSTGEDLTLKAGNLELQGQLQAGNDLTLEAPGSVLLTNSTIETTSTKYNYGEILIFAGNLDIEKTTLTADKTAQNHVAGDIILEAKKAISIKDSTISAEGNYGRVFIKADNQ
ncbi:MAG: filamentous hemagglutinin N-terminal domain-containing protein, partial [Rhizonema sp. PD38]|nr:filamentous hemagglutinin N-terminal domain-containing protein [Rhizonema sp. PD38]